MYNIVYWYLKIINYLHIYTLIVYIAINLLFYTTILENIFIYSLL